ncbi:hypothetical protein J1G42_12355 [Cellulomonas sp. zg-ZUI222]|uniref:Uncharacterized protein n=1 Tax=Cellulomonas wangleii TaxID=2816956 RepID=A0ABX8D7R1_9CELL|nr:MULTISPECIES: hypothetical protein [Cellulomonas]MBO0900960.1 hypothetical protein [Cellulomonas sp. zg-ZUI22]MBO0921615.1 hypothetical protein [Cellulomonas wangleii]MBO0925111.1 hypothetical protein [Cellulomonas wangleii]QVI63480.1 hypothetical protein KG103_06320 [Cellulomonas wangleii]
MTTSTVSPAFSVFTSAEVQEVMERAGTIRWNPSVEGAGATVVTMETFVWVQDTTTAATSRHARAVPVRGARSHVGWVP